jgi:hypothetical protein
MPKEEEGLNLRTTKHGPSTTCGEIWRGKNMFAFEACCTPLSSSCVIDVSGCVIVARIHFEGREWDI